MSSLIYQPTIALNTFIIGNVNYQDTDLDSNGNIAMLFSIDSVSQSVANAIQLFKGEYQFDTTQGINWLNILGQLSNRLLLNNYIQTTVLSVLYVKNIISINYISNDAGRTLSAQVMYNNTNSTVGVANANI